MANVELQAAAAAAAEVTTDPFEEKMSEEEVAARVDQITQILELPHHQVLVADEWDNERNANGHEGGIHAFAKLAGHGWTYYIRELTIFIGRHQDDRVVSSPSAEDHPVHVDLGPSKTVSRRHATIQYNADGDRPDGVGFWTVSVYGRNSIRLDGHYIRRGLSAELRSGSVLEISGTEMMFVLPSVNVEIASAYYQRAEANVDVDDEGDSFNNSFHAPTTTAPIKKFKNQKTPSSQSVLPSSEGPSQNTPVSVATKKGVGRKRSTESLASTEVKTRLEKAKTKTPPPKAQHARPAPPDPSPANFSRGMMLQGTSNSDIDYSLDQYQELKPAASYAVLIAEAILSSPGQTCVLNKIYEDIMKKYSWYRHTTSGWQNSIRHNLSLNKAFVKVPRASHEPGKGMKWKIAPGFQDEIFKRIDEADQKRGLRLSSPNSDGALNRDGTNDHLQDETPLVHDSDDAIFSESASKNRKKKRPAPAMESGLEGSRDIPQKKAKLPFGSHRSVTPDSVRGSYTITAKEAYTPDRGPKLPILRSVDRSSGENGASPSSPAGPMQARGNPMVGAYSVSDAAPGTSPANLPSQYLSDLPVDHPMFTPAPRRHVPMLAPQSTSQLPSSFMQINSSPAPFWKFAGGETPAQTTYFDLSPLKTGSKVPLAAASSSPPAIVNGRDGGSPMKGGTSRFSGGLNGDASGKKVDVNGSMTSTGRAVTGIEDLDDEEEELGIDLAK
jgi:forkhead protein FKH